MKVLPDSAADLIARLLKRRGITRVFALCGGHIMPIWMRLDAEGIRIIDVRDERAAVREAWDRVHHPSYPEVWERVLTQTRDPYEITARFEHAYARHAAHIDAYRHRFAFHPIHGILATHPLKRLRHVGRVIVAGAREAHVPRHLGWETAATVEEAVAGARAAHRPAVTIAVVEQPGMPADPDRAPRR